MSPSLESEVEPSTTEDRLGSTPTKPFVSIVVPCRNEARYIGKCLDSILASQYPQDRCEVLVVDGGSDDGTRAIVADYAGRHAHIRLLDNPATTTPAALNIGIRAARGERIVRMDAHTTYPPEYLGRLIDWQDKTGADNVGGVCKTLPDKSSRIAQAIATALSHPFGVGNSRFRIGTREPRWVDTVPFGCYRQEVFARIGLFDEELVRNQDDEFNLRLIRRGGRILLIPEVVSHYYARGSLAKLWRTFYQYGYFKPLVAKKVRGIFTVRQVVPAMFVSALLVTGALALWSPAMMWVWLGIVTSYAAAVLAQAAWLGRVSGLGQAIALCAVFPSIHLSYGLGWLRGISVWWLGRRGAKGGTMADSRSRERRFDPLGRVGDFAPNVKPRPERSSR